MVDSRIHQDLQVRSSEVYDDTKAMGITLQTGPVDIQGDENSIRSWLRAVNDLTVPWYTAPRITLATVLAHITRVTSTTLVVNASSPYAVLATDHTIFCDTDTGGIIVNLPAGVDGADYRIVNTGSSNGRVTVTPNGADILLGENSSIELFDGDIVIIVFEPAEGWW